MRCHQDGTCAPTLAHLPGKESKVADANVLIEPVQLGHIGIGQLEIEQRNVLAQPVHVRAFRNGRDATLQQMAQQYLCRRPVLALGNLLHYRVVQQVRHLTAEGKMEEHSFTVDLRGSLPPTTIVRSTLTSATFRFLSSRGANRRSR